MEVLSEYACPKGGQESMIGHRAQRHVLPAEDELQNQIGGGSLAKTPVRLGAFDSRNTVTFSEASPR